jgi:hypothetical protein
VNIYIPLRFGVALNERGLTMRTCEQCGKSFEAPRARYCSSTCRANKSRGAIPATAADPVFTGVGTTNPIGIVAAVAAELAAAGRLSTSLGQQALRLAVRLETSKVDTGAGLAALSKELRVVMATALADNAPAQDQIDEMAAKRDAKLERAAAG